ncbi:MAG: hypothetical protein AMS17_05570 [Spirochaetes bacterium DG_61]|nr:MAG: hypothetical protein AMS17_05570 [Spirochaetes bacterium DG_61]
MNFKDKAVRDMIDNLKNHYRVFVSNQFISYYLNESNIPKNDWIDIEDLIDSNKYFEGEGYDMERFYDQILTFSRFLDKLKKEVLSKMKGDVEKRLSRMSQDNKILYKMTIDNAPGNVKIFYDILTNLFMTVKKIDEKTNGPDRMMYGRHAYFKEIEKNLNV